MPLHIHTPLIESVPLSRAAGRSIWLKLEALQPPGSFKIRGIGAACEHYAHHGAKRFVSSSGGNAGLAVAYAGRHLAIPVTVVVPGTTPGTCIASLPKGWNSLGPAKAKPAPYANPDIWDRVWRWNTVTTQYEAVDEAGLMQPGCGYWIMPRKAISLDLGE